MTAASDHVELTRQFEAGQTDAANFHHAQHVQVAFGLLQKYDFIDAASIYAKGIRALAQRLDRPGKFNLTITYAFIGLIAERMAQGEDRDPRDFASRNPDLMTKDALAGWYDEDRLHSDLARRIFLMPAQIDPAQSGARAGRRGSL